MSESSQPGLLLSGSDPSAAPLWRPSEAAIAAANMTKFRTQVARDWLIGLKDTDALWDWSTQQVDRFWTSLWRYCDVIGQMGRPALIDGDRAAASCHDGFAGSFLFIRRSHLGAR